MKKIYYIYIKPFPLDNTTINLIVLLMERHFHMVKSVDKSFLLIKTSRDLDQIYNIFKSNEFFKNRNIFIINLDNNYRAFLPKDGVEWLNINKPNKFLDELNEKIDNTLTKNNNYNKIENHFYLIQHFFKFLIP